jgi:hypothetical protein
VSEPAALGAEAEPRTADSPYPGGMSNVPEPDPAPPGDAPAAGEASPAAGFGTGSGTGSTAGSGTGTAPGGVPGADVDVSREASAASAALVFDDPLDRPSADDTDHGWGGSFAGTADDEFTRFLNEKPPHHL